MSDATKVETTENAGAGGRPARAGYAGRRRRTGAKPRKPAERFWDKVERRGDCLVWTASTNRGKNGKGGYGTFMVRKVDGRGQFMSAHRFSYEMENGPIPEGAIILHSCDNRACVNPAHLRAGTYVENSQDALERGRHRGPSGETHPAAKLTDEQVHTVRQRYAAGGITQRELADEFGVDRSTVSRIVTKDSRTA